MAIAQGNTVLNSDLQSYYTSFNSFISAYGGNITQLTTPTANKKVEAIDINNLNAKINEFQSDEYLGTQPTWWVNASVTIGDIIYATDVTGINTTIANMANVVCRNLATNNYSNNGECCNSNDKSVCCNSNDKSVCCNSNDKSVCCNSNDKSVCCNTNSNHGQTCSNGTFTFGFKNSANSGGIGVSNEAVMQANGYSCSVTVSGTLLGTGYCRLNGSVVQVARFRCNVTCGYSTNGNACNNSKHTQTCNNSKHTQTCNNSKHTQTCNNSKHTQTCNNSKHTQTCNNSKHTQTCNNSTNARTCSNTSTIDITCQQATKTNN